MANTDAEGRDAMLAMIQQVLHLSPGMGLGTPAWDPNAGLEKERRRRAAKGLSAEQRIQALTDAGVTDRAGMQAVAERMYASPEKAFMLARRK